MRIVVRCFLVLAAFIAMSGCGGGVDREEEIERLLEADREFSRLSVENGAAAAFVAFAAEDAVIYRDQRHPVEGRQAIHELLRRSEGTLRWDPYFVDLAGSGDLGYTRGTYVYAFTDSTGAENRLYGYYVSIWKKQRGGDWKYVFDSGIGVPDSLVVGE